METSSTLAFAARARQSSGAHGVNTLEHQPARIAAIEGHWENIPGQPSPRILFGWPDMKAEKRHFAIEVPLLGSLILWLVAFWAGGVTIMGLVVELIRLSMAAAGMKTH